MKKSNNINSQTAQAFQLGGTVQLPGFTGMQITQPTAPTTSYRPYVQPIQAASSQFVPQFTGVQYTTATGTTNIPTFAETVGRNPGQYDEFRTYVNDAGQTLQIPFKNGQPIYPIPYGYRYQAEEAVTPTDTSTVPTTVVGQDDGGGDGGDRGVGVPGAVQGPAGKGPTGLAGITSAISGLSDYFSGAPAKAEPYKGTTLDSLNAMGMVSRDSKGNIIGPSVTDFSNNIAGVKDAFGVYGTEPINVSALGSVLTGNLLGAFASVRDRDSSIGMFGQAAPTGYGAFSTEDLMDYAQGRLNPADAELLGIAMDKNQAFARAQVQRAIGTPITGLIGYKPGSISPTSKTPVNKWGQTVNYRGSTTGVDPEFSSMGDWMDAMKAGIESGFYGGFKDKAEVAMMSDKQRAKYAAYATARGANPNGQDAGAGKAAEIGLGDPERGEVSATPGGTAGVPGSQGRADYSGGYQGSSPSGGDGMGNTGEDTSGEDPTGGSPSGGNDGSDNDGNGSGGSSCFAAGTKFFMEDGSLKNIEDIKIGDVLQRGGKVRTTIVGDGLYENWYLYGNTKVTGTHTLFENGTWKRV